MMIILLILLNVQVAFLIFAKMSSEDIGHRDKIRDEFQKEIIKKMDILDSRAKIISDTFDKKSGYLYNICSEIETNTRKSRYIYNLLLLNESERYDEIQATDLEFEKALGENDKEQMEKILEMMTGRWEIRKRQIEK